MVATWYFDGGWHHAGSATKQTRITRNFRNMIELPPSAGSAVRRLTGHNEGSVRRFSGSETQPLKPTESQPPCQTYCEVRLSCRGWSRIIFTTQAACPPATTSRFEIAI